MSWRSDSRSPSIEYAAPTSRRFDYRESESRFEYRRDSKSSRSYKRSRTRSRSRSRSKSRSYNPRDRHDRRSPSQSPSDKRYRRSHSPNEEKPKPRVQFYPWEDEETLRSLHCKACDVTLNDRDSMYGHLKGNNHLMQLKRLKDHKSRLATGRGLQDNLVPDQTTFDENYWKREKGPQKLRPEQERFLDTGRHDRMPAKFDRRTYDYGQYKFDENELYCQDCDVRVRSRDQMQAHKEGANHKKKSAKVQRFECKLCLIEVPCQDTLDNHMRGKDHIKRANQLAEKRRQRGGHDPDDDRIGYKTGPGEMAKLNNDEYEELKKLRQENKILKQKIKDFAEFKQKCVNEHGNEEFEALKQHKRFCLENHIRPKEYNRKGLFVKTESFVKHEYYEH